MAISILHRITGDGLRLTMVGHATLLIQVAGMNILTDPVWSDRASPVSFAGPKRVNEPGIPFDDLPPESDLETGILSGCAGVEQLLDLRLRHLPRAPVVDDRRIGN